MPPDLKSFVYFFLLTLYYYQHEKWSLIVWFNHFLNSKAEINQIFAFLFGNIRYKKSHSEINWPLAALLANTPKSIKVDARESRTSHTRTVHTLSRKEILCKACVDKMDKFTFASSFLASYNHFIDRLCDTCQGEFPRVCT